MADLSGRVALVTGGASGIGAGIASVLSEAGASVAIGAVNAVCPGVARTPLWDHPDTGILRDLDGENGWDAFVGGIPLGRPQSALDIGHACAYLASEAAASITGEALNVSGGQQMH